MIDPIPIIARQEVDEQTSERAAELASALRDPIRSDADLSRLRERQAAAMEIAELAESAPAAVIPDCPTLVRALEEELAREDVNTSAATALFNGAVSTEIQIRLTEAIETISTGAVVAQYEESDESVSSLFSVLAQGVIGSDENGVISNALRALCGFTQYRPGMVSKAIADEGDPSAVLNLLTQILYAVLNRGSTSLFSGVNNRGSLAWWARLAAVITVRNQHPDHLPSTHPFWTLPVRLQSTDDIAAVVFGDLLERTMPAHRKVDMDREFSRETTPVYTPVPDSVEAQPVELGSETVTEASEEGDKSDLSPIARIQQNGPDSDAAEAFGEVIAACPQVIPDPPWPLVDHVRELEQRQHAARALGGVAAVGAETPTKQVQLAIRWIDATGTIRWRQPREMLGEIVAAHGDVIDIPDPIRPLVEKVRTGVGRPRVDAALALGVAVYQNGDPSTTVDPTPVLRRYVREEQSFSEAAAKGLGEAVITMDPQTCTVSAPSTAIGHVRGDTGRSRTFSTRALGLATATDSPADLPTRLVSQAHTGKGQVRWIAGRTLGELVGILDVSSDSTPWPESLLEQLRGADNPLRFERAELVGVAVATLEADAHGIDDPTRLGRSGLSGPDRLLLYVLTNGGMARYDIQEVVGELAVAEVIQEHTPALLRPLVRQTADANGSERRTLARTLGEAVAVTFGTNSGLGVIYELTRQVQTEEGILRDQAAQALGEAIAVFDGSHQTLDLEGIIADSMHDASGESRWNLARALGELHAAIDRPDTASDPVEAIIDAATGGDEIEWSATAAIGAIATLNPDVTDFVLAVPDDLIAAVDSAGGTNYRAALEAVGSVVLGIGDTFVTTAVSDALESSARETRAELLPAIAATEVFSPDEFLQLLADAVPADSGQGFRAYFDSDIRDHVIAALQACYVEQDPA